MLQNSFIETFYLLFRFICKFDYPCHSKKNMSLNDICQWLRGAGSKIKIQYLPTTAQTQLNQDIAPGIDRRDESAIVIVGDDYHRPE